MKVRIYLFDNILTKFCAVLYNIVIIVKGSFMEDIYKFELEPRSKLDY